MTDNLPFICMRCNQPIMPGQPTERISFIPRWGMTAGVHVGCVYPKLSVWHIEKDGEWHAPQDAP